MKESFKTILSSFLFLIHSILILKFQSNYHQWYQKNIQIFIQFLISVKKLEHKIRTKGFRPIVISLNSVKTNSIWNLVPLKVPNEGQNAAFIFLKSRGFFRKIVAKFLNITSLSWSSYCSRVDNWHDIEVWDYTHTQWGQSKSEVVVVGIFILQWFHQIFFE